MSPPTPSATITPGQVKPSETRNQTRSPAHSRRSSCTSALPLLLLLLAPGQTARPRIATESDLPRSTYPVPGTATELITADPATFNHFAAPVSADVAHILSTCQIDDHATLRQLLSTQLNLQILAGGPEDRQALATIAQIRALEDKPAEKLTSDLREESFLKARLASAPAAAACPSAYAANLRSALDPLPWQTVGTSLSSEKGMVEIASPSLFAGFRDRLRPGHPARPRRQSLRRRGDHPRPRRHRRHRRLQVPSVDALTAYIAQHKVTEPDIWSAREAVLPTAAKLTPVNVAIWDSGIDTTLFPAKLYTTSGAPAEDPHGIAFDLLMRPTHGELIPLNQQQNAAYPALVASLEGLGDLENGIDSPASTRSRCTPSSTTSAPPAATPTEPTSPASPRAATPPSASPTPGSPTTSATRISRPKECIPSSFQLPNLLVTGAVDQAGDETSFTSYGDNVFIDADGASVVPGGARVKMSGTSMAAPGVTTSPPSSSPSTPPQLITLIRNGADTTPDGRRHLLNPKRSVDLLEAKAQAN